MQDISTLYALFIAWTSTAREEYVRECPTATFINIGTAGRGFIGDGAGGSYFEFDTIQDGIKQLRTAAEKSE